MLPQTGGRKAQLAALRRSAQLASTLARSMARRVTEGPRHESWPLRFELVMGFMRALLEVDHHAAAHGQRTRMSFVPPRLLTKVKISHDEIAGVRVEVHTPVDHRAGGVTLLYLHGGGYVTCSPGSHKHVIAALAHLTGARVVAPAYRLAPEHPFPAALEDVTAVYRALLGRAGSADRLLLAGDSAGGGLSLALALHLRALGVALPRAVALISPWVDLSLTRTELEPLAHYDYLRPKMLEETAQLYAQDTPLDHPLVSPIRADLTGLPPLFIVTGALEIFHDQNSRFVARAREHGVMVEHLIEPGMLHAFPAFSALASQGRDALLAVGRFLQKQTQGDHTVTPSASVGQSVAKKSA